MPPTHLSSTSRALYRVFVLPSLRTPTTIPLCYAPAFTRPYPSQYLPVTSSHTSIRTKSYTRDTQRHALTDHYVLDTAIEADRINYVDHDGKYYPDIVLREALDETDRTKYYLVQVAPGLVDAFGNADPDNLPTCRVVSKMELRMQHTRKMDIERRQARGPVVKNLELNWAIAGGDLKHRLGRLQDFLRQGRKVEVLLGPKKRGRTATEEEASGVLRAVRDAVAECKGAAEVKEEGTTGGVLTLVFQGKKIKEMKGGRKEGEDEDAEEEEGDNETAEEIKDEEETVKNKRVRGKNRVLTAERVGT